MVCAAEQDPVAAIVLHSLIRDIETVIADGKIRKRGRRLVAVNVDPASIPGASIAKHRIEWRYVVQEVLRSRGEIEN